MEQIGAGDRGGGEERRGEDGVSRYETAGLRESVEEDGKGGEREGGRVVLVGPVVER